MQNRAFSLHKSTLFKTSLIVCLCLSVISCTSLEKSSRKYNSKHPIRVYAIVDVSIINLEMESVLEHQTLIIEDQRISKIGPFDNTNLPADARIILGSGKYLLPGFIDMHVHISDETDLLKFLKHGVTTVRHMADVPWWAKAMGFPDAVSLREKQNRGEIIGPDIYTTGLTLDGDSAVSPMNKKITSPKDAEKEIKGEKDAGYDFIKIYDNLTPETFDAILSAAREYDIPVVGHVPFEVGIDAVLQSSVLSIEHLTGYINNNAATFIIPEDKVEYYAKMTRQSGIYNCPTLVI
jgi:broad-specificity NMP kinase